MKKGKTTLIILGALGLVFSLAIAPLSANAVPPALPCVKFTVKDVDIPGSENCNSEANDITVVFRGPATIQFTKDGIAVGDPIPKAKGANDFEVNFVPGTCDIISGTWTNKGVPIEEPIPIPPEPVNDFEFEAKRIVTATWTLDGEPIADIPRPKGHVTDIHFKCVPFPDG